MKLIKVAAVQMDPKLGERQKNERTILRLAKEAVENGASIITFPECTINGIVTSSKEETHAISLPRNGEWTKKYEVFTEEYNCYLVIGTIEEVSNKLYNSVYLFGEGRILHIYTKAHLTNIGADCFVELGNTPFETIDTKIGKIGLFICYDSRFPELARILGLQGAQILLHSTNLPLVSIDHMDILLPARANENRLFIVSAGRVGVEKESKFLGKSTIYGLKGEKIVEADGESEVIIYADLPLATAKEKDVVMPPTREKPFTQVNKLFSARRPDLYQGLDQDFFQKS